jgi:hypothetical protein
MRTKTKPRSKNNTSQLTKNTLHKSSRTHSGMFLLIFACLIGVCLSIIIFHYSKQPSNTRDWRPEFERLAYSIENSSDPLQVKLVNARSFFNDSLTWFNTTLDLSKIQTIYFLVEPFDKWDAVAHTFLLIDFENQSIGFSVEARRENNETYGAIKGLFRTFEIIYIWGTQDDVLKRRAQAYSVFMYPLNLTSEQKIRLVQGLLHSTNQLKDKPQFYHTISSTCTTHLASIAHTINNSAVPYNIAWNLPGKSDQFLYEQGLLAIASAPLVSRYTFDVSPTIRTTSDYTQLIRQQVFESAQQVLQ